MRGSKQNSAVAPKPYNLEARAKGQSAELGDVYVPQIVARSTRHQKGQDRRDEEGVETARALARLHYSNHHTGYENIS